MALLNINSKQNKIKKTKTIHHSNNKKRKQNKKCELQEETKK